MATITIDGRTYQAEAGENLLKACIKLGIDVPYFCYHPALGSVGSCRLCAVKRYRDANDTKGRIIMSCMEPVSEGMILSVNDEEVKDFRASIIEGMMTNHPHDCPICDEGGECHLQDMVVMTGHNYRRFEFKKRTYKNQYLGPNIQHEMNRCIQCYRCVRYYKDYAGGTDFGVFGAHNHLYFGRAEDGALESPFSGNLVEVCPTGVFTDKTLKKHYTRKWDLTNAPSICTQCAVGCNTIVGERYGEVRRVLNRNNPDVNGYFLCDKGRFGYEFINAETRIKESVYKATAETKVPINSDDAVKRASYLISQGKTIGIGSPGASIEANFALQKLVGKENFYAGITKAEIGIIKQIIATYKSKTTNVFSLKEVEKAEGVLILGEDILKTAPRLALAVHQSVKNKPNAGAAKLNIPEWHNAAVKTAVGDDKGPLFVLTPEITWTDAFSTKSIRANTENILRLAYAIFSAVGGSSKIADFSSEEKENAKIVANELKSCKSVAIISGTQAGSEELIEVSAKIATALNSENRTAGIYCVVKEANTLGLAMMTDQYLEQAFDKLETGDIQNAIVLENNIYERADRFKVDSALSKCKNIIVADHTQSELSSKANLLLASGTFAESEGTIVNNEGRMQRYFSVLPVKDHIVQSWKWFLNIKCLKISFEDLHNDISTAVPEFDKIKEVAPEAGFRDMGMKVPRQTPRFSGRTSMNANVNLHEPKPIQDENSALAFSMEGSRDVQSATLTAFYMAPGWNSVQASNRYLRDLDNVLRAKEFGIRIW
jgi:NADH-quinone oxidoreductase subunit G